MSNRIRAIALFAILSFFGAAAHADTPAPPTITEWLAGLMIAKAPPDRLASLPQFRGWEETAEQKRVRYGEIAEAVYRVTYDPAESPVFGGKLGRARTATLLLAIAFYEGGFAHDVDKGPCFREGKHKGRCDGGLSACLMQLRVGRGTTTEGWTQADLFADREKCFRAGLHRVQTSFRACRRDGDADARLDAYVSGLCHGGTPAGRARLALGRSLFDRPGRPPGTDDAFLRAPPAPAAAPPAAAASAP